MYSRTRLLTLLACLVVPSAAQAAIITNNVTVFNNTGSTQTYSAFVGLPLPPDLYGFASAEGMLTVTPGLSGTGTVDLAPGNLFLLTGSGFDGGFVDLGVGTGTSACVAVRGPQTCILPLVTNSFLPTAYTVGGSQLRFTLTSGATAAFTTTVTIEPAQAPEPSTLLLLGTAAAGAWGARRRRPGR